MVKRNLELPFIMLMMGLIQRHYFTATYSITDEDNYQTLLEKAYVGCVEVLHEAANFYRLVRSNP